jgi:uncharacterized membrane protein
MRNNFVLPLLTGFAFLALGLGLPVLVPKVSKNWGYALALVALVSFVISYRIARSGVSNTQSRGGRGGSATATGENAEADGGAGGKANGGVGGDGGSAQASGKGARARGGAGGTG